MEESQHKHLTIKSWAEDDRPREKLVTKDKVLSTAAVTGTSEPQANTAAE